MEPLGLLLKAKALLCNIFFSCDLRHTFHTNMSSSSCALGPYVVRKMHKEIIMKIIVSALLALSVIAGIAAPASAYDPWKDDVGLRSPL